MEINIKEIMNKVKTTAQTVGSKATEIGKGLMSTTKINLRIIELSSQIEADYKAAGKLLYAAHTGEEVDSDAIEDILNGIDGKREEVAALKDQLVKPTKAAEPSKTCPVCGNPVSDGNVFCATCGTKLDFAEPAEEKAEEAVEEAAEEIKEVVAETLDEAEEAVETVEENVKGVFEDAGEVIEGTAEKAAEKFEGILDEIIKEKDE